MGIFGGSVAAALALRMQDNPAVTAMLDRLLQHAHVLTCGPRSWRTRLYSERTAP